MTGSKQNVTIAFHKDGTSELIHGPEVAFKEQSATVDALRKDGLAEHIERVEIWGRNRVKFAWRQAVHIAKASEDEAKILADKAKAEAAALADKAKAEAAALADKAKAEAAAALAKAASESKPK